MSSKKITLTSSDGESFEVDEEVAMESPTIKRMIEDDHIKNEITVPNVTGKILSKVIEYCTKHAEAGKKTGGDHVDEDLKAFDTELVKVDHGTLFALVLAANLLNVKGLLKLACQTVDDMIRRTTAEEIMEMLKE